MQLDVLWYLCYILCAMARISRKMIHSPVNQLGSVQWSLYTWVVSIAVPKNCSQLIFYPTNLINPTRHLIIFGTHDTPIVMKILVANCHISSMLPQNSSQWPLHINDRQCLSLLFAPVLTPKFSGEWGKQKNHKYIVLHVDLLYQLQALTRLDCVVLLE